jgi:hypothetical protein
LEPPNIQDPAAAFDHFDKFRARIESAASENFDRNGLDAEKYDGMQISRLRSEATCRLVQLTLKAKT